MLKLKTIFITIPWFHPAYKAGGPVQSIANMVAQYGQEGLNFKIFCSNADLGGAVNQGVRFNEWCYYNQHTQVWYQSKNNFTGRAMRREIRNSGATILFIIGIYSLYFNLLPLLFGKAPVKIVSARGMLHAGALSQKSFKKKIYLAIWKMAGIPRRYCFHATDEREKGFIRQVLGEQARVFIAGNFPRIFSLQPVMQKKTGALLMVSIALISPMKNILAILDALQCCSKKIIYDIYGPVKDHPYWLQCLAKIQMLPVNIIVCYQGVLLPAKIEDTLKEYHVFILPSKSENFGHAIYEALSAGKPVITSHHTPFNDLYGHRAGRNVSAENISEMAEAIDFFAGMTATEFADWNTGANNYALKHIDIDQLKSQYNEMFS